MKKTALLLIISIIFTIGFGSVTTFAGDIPVLVVDLATPGNGASYIQLSWGETNYSGIYYIVERKINNENFERIKNPTNTGSETDILLGEKTGSLCSYRIAVYDNTYKLIGYSNVVSFVLSDSTEPYNFTAESIGNDKIALSWDYVQSTPVATIIERKDDSNSTYKQIGGTTGSDHYFEDCNIEQGKSYTYRIKSVVGANCYTRYVYTYSIKQPLNTPTDFNVSLIYLNDKQNALLEWSNIWSQDVTTSVYRKTNDESSFTKIKVCSNNEGLYLDTDIISGNTYTYKIQVEAKYNSFLMSPFSEEITIIAIDLKAPTAVSAVATSSTTAEISWQDNSNNESGFEIWRNKGDGTAWEKYTVVSANVLSFTDKNLSPSSTYTYKVRAFSSIANVHSYFSSEVVIKTIFPSANIILDYSLSPGLTPIISWNVTGSLDDITVFQLERKGEFDVTWSKLASFSPDTKNFTDTVLTPYSNYYYRLKLLDRSTNSILYSNTLQFATGIPKAPTILEASTLGPNTVQLSWNDKSMNEDGFIIEKYVSGMGFLQVARVPSGQTTYIDNMLPAGQGYNYRVCAYNKSGFSEYTNEKYFYSKNPTAFYDMADSSWAMEAVVNLAGAEIVSGTSQGYFSPDNNISRAEFTSIVVKALKLTAQGAGGFSDIKPSDWYYDDIVTAKALGIVSGTNGFFYPGSSITREDMSVILCKALDAANKPLAGKASSILDSYFDRSEVSDYSVSYLSSMKAAGLLNGKDGNRLAPKDNLNRAEAATIIWRVLSSK